MIRSHVSNIPNFGVIENYSFNNINVQAARKSKDAISSSVAPISDETGHKAWSAMPLLCYFLLSTNGRQLLHSKDIIELGSGLGVPGLLAARHLSCKNVTLSDFNPRVVECLIKSAALTKSTTNSCQTNAVTLDWNEIYPKTTTKKYDIVIASDVIYSQASAAIFFRTSLALLRDESPTSLIILAYCPRWSVVDHALHVAMKESSLIKQFVPLRDFAPPNLLQTMPNGACLILLSTPFINQQEEKQEQEQHVQPQPQQQQWRMTTTPMTTTPMTANNASITQSRLLIAMEDLEWIANHDIHNLQWDCESTTIETIEIALCGPRKITEQNLLALGAIFNCVTNVTSLIIRNTWIESKTLIVLADIIHHTLPKLIDVRLRNLIGIDWCFNNGNVIHQFIGSMPKAISVLFIHDCNFNNTCCQHLVEHLTATAPCFNLTTLCLSNNGITSLGALYLGKLLFLFCKTLLCLDISGNDDIGANGAAEIGDVVADAIVLKELNVSGCGLGDVGVKWLMQGLVKCETLKVLKMASNGLEREGCMYILKCCQGFEEMKLIDLSNNFGGEDGGDGGDGGGDIEMTELIQTIGGEVVLSKEMDDKEMDDDSGFGL